MGGDRQWRELQRHFTFADPEEARKKAFKVQTTCETCQACEHPHQPLKLRITATPVPPHVLTSMAIDLFVMPEVQDNGFKFHVFAAAVDRHSGWYVATAHHTRGLTAARVAQDMYTHR